MSQDQFSGDGRSSEGTWERLSQVAAKGAEYDSRERQPHPKCLEGTRIDILNYIHGLLDDQEKNRIIWLNGTAGVGKSAVAFTVAERMRGLKVTEWMTVENRLAGSFFFSRKHTKRCTTGYFFATLAYQLASNFPSVREDLNIAIRENPAILDPDKSLRDQMEALFIRPLRQLRLRLRNNPPLVFVIDALDECTSENETADLISLLGQALCKPDVPMFHILLTSRSEAHIHDAIQEEGVRPLVCEIPVKTSGDGVAKIISLDGVDVDNDINIFLEQSFRKLRSRCSNFKQLTRDELERLASRAGRRFIVASTMVKFIDDGYNDPHDRLQLMLELTSKLLSGTEVYKLYDSILLTCSDPMRAYLHLSVVAALADPLPISHISELLGPGEGRDVETALIQLRSIMDIPTDSSLPVNIYHSSVRDYVSNPSNCSLPQIRYRLISPHSLLARSSLRLIIQAIPANTTLLDALLELKEQSQAMRADDPRSLKYSLSFIVQPPEPLKVLTYLLWLRGVRGPGLQCWLGDQDGRSWLQTRQGNHWLGTQDAEDWLTTRVGEAWLQTRVGKAWLQTRSGRRWLQSSRGWLWTQRWPTVAEDLVQHGWLGELETQHGDQLETSAEEILDEDIERVQLRASGWNALLRGWSKHLRNWSRRVLLESWCRRNWLTTGRRECLQIRPERHSLSTLQWQNWVLTPGEGRWLQTPDERRWLRTSTGQDWLQSQRGRAWLHTHGGREWLQSLFGQVWLQSPDGREWLQSWFGKEWLQTPHAGEWLQTWSGQEWLEAQNGQYWLQSQSGLDWLQTKGGREWLQAPSVQKWLQTLNGQEWLQTLSGRNWLQTQGAQEWLQTLSGRQWLQAHDGHRWLQITNGRKWLQTPGGREWLQTSGGGEWLQTQGGQVWLQTMDMRYLLRTQSWQDWLQSPGGRDWLQGPSGRDWMRTPDGQAWQLTSMASIWVMMEDFSSTLEAINEYAIIRELPLSPAFQVIQHFKSLPDFLMFPAFLVLMHRSGHVSASPHDRVLPDMDIIHAMMAFRIFADEAQERSQSASDALKYACQNFTIHLSQAPKPWDDNLHHAFKSFWNDHLLSWLEMQWCLKGLRSCLIVLSEGQKLAKHLEVPGSSQS